MVLHVRLTEQRVTMERLLANSRSFSILPSFLILMVHNVMFENLKVKVFPLNLSFQSAILRCAHFFMKSKEIFL